MSAKSGSSIQLSQLEEIIRNLPEEYRNAMNNVIVVDAKVIKNQLSDQIYDAKKEILIEELSTQINFTVSKALKDPKYSSIKKDILFYKKAYENEAANVNKIIEATNKLNHELLEPLKEIKNALNKHYIEFKNNIENIKKPHEGMNKGVDSIKNNEIQEDKKQESEEDKKALDKLMDSYKEKAINFFKDYNFMNEDLSLSIKDFLDSFTELKNNITELKKEISNGFYIFENISPDLENLDNQENIRKLTEKLLFPLNTITELINKSQEQFLLVKEKNLTKKDEQEQKKEKRKGIANEMIEICSDLKSKAGNIGEKINDIRMKVNLQNLDIPPMELKEPNVEEINDNLEDMMKNIEQTREDNNTIQEQVLKRTKDFLNQTRLDILFIIDCTNSVNTYLVEIKSNFTKMINDIQKTCPMATIYIGFIGYLDFLDLQLDDEYIDIPFTTKIDEIMEKIKNLKSRGGGDIAEDVAGAFEMALNKDWQGISRFAILAADAPCHGVEFHGRENNKDYDDYPKGDPKNRDIKKFVRQFAENGISLFCAKFNKETDMMFNIFNEEYKKGKKEGSNCEFTTESCEDLCDIIIQKATQVYQINRKEEIENISNE